jgi:hypothetical protein
VSLTVTDAVKIYKGSLCAVNAAGEVEPATAATTLTGMGRAVDTVDNAADGEVAEIEMGVFRWTNQGDITIADLHALCYAYDDQTVGQTAGGARSAVGTIVDVDADGVWVASTPGTVV